MAKRDKDRTSSTELTITYQSLGTITLDEQKQAIWEDIQALSDEFGVSYLNSVELVIRATNESGEPVQIRRLSTGATVRRLDTHHYRPACLDYKL